MKKKQQSDRENAIQCYLKGDSVTAIARKLGYSRPWVYKWIERFRKHGIAGLSDGKRTGRPPVFSPRSRAASGQDRLRTAG